MNKIPISTARKSLPSHICQEAERQMGNSRRLYFEYHPEGSTLYLDEGSRYTFFRGESLEPARRVTMMSERTLCNDPDKLAWKVGQRIPFPAGTYVIEDQIFLGKRLITVHAWGISALPGCQNAT